jgi:hypothetical protein
MDLVILIGGFVTFVLIGMYIPESWVRRYPDHFYADYRWEERFGKED